MDSRDTILQAAGEVFAEKPFHQATVRDICRKAGANISAINYHFGDKNRLYVEAVSNARQLLEQRVPLPEWDDSTPADDRLRMFISTVLQRMLGNSPTPWQSRLILREVLNPSEACRELVQDWFAPYFSVLVEIIGLLVPKGTPIYRLHQLAFSVIGQCFYYRAQSQIVEMLISLDEKAAHYSPEQLTDHIVDFTLAGFRGMVPPPANDLLKQSSFSG